MPRSSLLTWAYTSGRDREESLFYDSLLCRAEVSLTTDIQQYLAGTNEQGIQVATRQMTWMVLFLMRVHDTSHRDLRV